MSGPRVTADVPVAPLAGGDVRLSGVHPAWRALFELMSRAVSCRLVNLQIVDGLPQLSTVEVVRLIHLGGGRRTKRQTADDNYVLKRHAVRFIEEASRLQNGCFESVIVQDGLPVKLRLREKVGQ